MNINLNREQTNHLLKWEKIEQDAAIGKHSYRAPVVGGWLIRFVDTAAHPQISTHIFIADKNHIWGQPDDAPASKRKEAN